MRIISGNCDQYGNCGLCVKMRKKRNSLERLSDGTKEQTLKRGMSKRKPVAVKYYYIIMLFPLQMH